MKAPAYIAKLAKEGTIEIDDGHTTFTPNKEFLRRYRANPAGAARNGFSYNEHVGYVTWAPPSENEIDFLVESALMEPNEPEKIARPHDPTIMVRPYQLAAAERCIETPTLLADEQGLGKTMTSLLAAKTLAQIWVDGGTTDALRVLVICPAVTRIWWEREARRVLGPEWFIYMSRGRSPVTAVNDDKGKHLYICGSSTIAYQHELRERFWDCLIVDEAHQFKEPTAARTRAVMGVMKTENYDENTYRQESDGIKAEWKIFLTGTPIPKAPADIYPLARALWGEEEFGSYHEFGVNFCGARKQFQPWRKKKDKMGWNYRPKFDMTRKQDREESRRRLRELRILLLRKGMIRRTKEQAWAELPPKTYQVIPMEPSGALLKASKSMESALDIFPDIVAAKEAVREAKNEREQERALEVLAQVVRAHQGELAEEYKKLGMEKAGALLETFKDMLENAHDSLVIFAKHRCVVEALHEGLAEYNAVKLYGNMSDEEKQESVDKFQSGESRVFVGNIIAAGVGITLTRSSHAVFIESDYVPGNMAQAADRIHRIGQTKPCLIQHYVLDGSVDSLIAESQANRAKIINYTVDGEELAVGDEEGLRKKASEKDKWTVRAQEKYLHGDMLEAKRPLLKEALVQIDRACGGGVNDGVGWSSAHQDFGSSLANQTYDLTDEQCIHALRLVKHYRKQVESGLLYQIFAMTERDGAKPDDGDDYLTAKLVSGDIGFDEYERGLGQLGLGLDK